MIPYKGARSGPWHTWDRRPPGSPVAVGETLGLLCSGSARCCVAMIDWIGHLARRCGEAASHQVKLGSGSRGLLGGDSRPWLADHRPKTAKPGGSVASRLCRRQPRIGSPTHFAAASVAAPRVPYCAPLTPLSSSTLSCVGRSCCVSRGLLSPPRRMRDVFVISCYTLVTDWCHWRPRPSLAVVRRRGNT